MAKKSKNDITIEQLNISCHHVKELERVGMTENFGIRNLELFADIYAKLLIFGRATPQSAGEVDLWSNQAKKARQQNPEAKFGQIVRVEHGTPRRQFARSVLRLFEKGQLTRGSMDELVRKKWKLAVISREEDRLLNKRYRSTEFNTPEERWTAGGIEF